MAWEWLEKYLKGSRSTIPDVQRCYCWLQQQNLNKDCLVQEEIGVKEDY